MMSSDKMSNGAHPETGKDATTEDVGDATRSTTTETGGGGDEGDSRGLGTGGG
jgi:hypothetical protein